MFGSFFYLLRTRGLNVSLSEWLTFVEAMDKVVASQEFKDFMAQRNFGIDYRDAAGFEAFMKDADESIGQALKAVGLAK